MLRPAVRALCLRPELHTSESELGEFWDWFWEVWLPCEAVKTGSKGIFNSAGDMGYGNTKGEQMARRILGLRKGNAHKGTERTKTVDTDHDCLARAALLT